MRRAKAEPRDAPVLARDGVVRRIGVTASVQSGEPKEGRPSLVWGLAVAQAIGWGALYFSFAVFIAPMEQELGWSRSELNGALTIGLLTTGLASIPFGTWVDFRGGHALMTIGSLVGVASLIGWSFVETLPGFYLVWIGIGIATAATVADIPFAVVTANVRDYRGAIASILSISGLASGIFVPLSHGLIGLFGWRIALLWLAAFLFFGAALIYAFVLRGTTGSRTGERLRARGVVPAGQANLGSPLRAALAKPAFWGLALSYSSISLAFTAITFHLIPLSVEQGLSPGFGVAALAAIGPSQIIGRLLVFPPGSTRSSRSIGRIMTPLIAASLLFLLGLRWFGSTGLLLFAISYGMAHGSMAVVRAAGTVEILGERGFGAIGGALNLVLVLPRTAAPLLTAFIWSLGGSYDLVIATLFVTAVIGAIAFWFAARER